METSHLFVCGDSKLELPKFVDNSIDLVLTDPPYGLEIFGADWDQSLPDPEIWAQCKRVLKPGGFALVMAGARQDCLSRVIHDLGGAGFNMAFPMITWVYHTGSPKGQKADEAGEEWIGWRIGSGALKPAHEQILVCQKPLFGSVVHNLTTYGVGAFNCADTEIPYADEADKAKAMDFAHKMRERDWGGPTAFQSNTSKEVRDKNGRHPPTLLVEDSALGDRSKAFDLDNWFLMHYGEYLPIFDEPLFLDISKPSRHETEAGCEALPADDRGHHNPHPTPKPIKLMTWLINLVTKPGAIVLDPFVGGGATTCAAVLTDRNSIDIDINAEYLACAKARCKHLQGEADL